MPHPFERSIAAGCGGEPGKLRGPPAELHVVGGDLIRRLTEAERQERISALLLAPVVNQGLDTTLDRVFVRAPWIVGAPPLQNVGVHTYCERPLRMRRSEERSER